MSKKIVVIGSGLAGTLLCNELGKTAEVTLLEAGERDRIYFPEINYLNKRFAEVNTFCIAGGGTTNLWHNGLIPIDLRDVSSSCFKEVLNEAAPYMDKAASKLFFKDSSFLAEYHDSISKMELISEKIGKFDNGIDCLLYPKKYKKLTPDPSVNVRYSVSDIHFFKSGPKIKKIEYRIGENEYAIHPDLVIISAGSIGSPKLIKEILLDHNNLDSVPGVGLADHPMGFVGKVKFKKDISSLMSKFALSDMGNYECRTAVRLKSDCGKFTGGAFFRPALTMDNRLSVYKFKSSLGASNGLRRLKNIFNLKIFHPDIIAEIFSHLFGFNIQSRVYNILFIAEQKRGGNSVAYDQNRIKIDWRITKSELGAYISMLIKLRNMLREISDDLNIITNITEDWLWSAAHHSGTISLGETEKCLVDKNLKLKNYDNVFVCDGSVIQEHSYANTGLTIGQLAIRLSERLAH